MLKDYYFNLVNGHIVFGDENNLILDTGSPFSFHTSGKINLCGEDIPVSTSILGVDTDYLSSNVGARIEGLVGMDIINRYPIMVDVPNGHLIIGDDAVYSPTFESFNLGPVAYGLMAIVMLVNNKSVRMVVDTAAPTSYIINESIIADLESEDEINDFHPFIGNFSSKTYRCDVIPVVNEKPYSQLFGFLQNALAKTLSILNVDGIIGMDLFKRYPIQIKDGKLFLPPQGT